MTEATRPIDEGAQAADSMNLDIERYSKNFTKKPPDKIEAVNNFEVN